MSCARLHIGSCFWVRNKGCGNGCTLHFRYTADYTRPSPPNSKKKYQINILWFKWISNQVGRLTLDRSAYLRLISIGLQINWNSDYTSTFGSTGTRVLCRSEASDALVFGRTLVTPLTKVHSQFQSDRAETQSKHFWDMSVLKAPNYVETSQNIWFQF